MNDRSHLSIGEVLSLLQKDFPDVTISKIRFLESQGLLDPERTPSGYRKFYEADIVRLRWILRQQRENFLPLKVIKERLAAGDPELEAEAEAAVVDETATADGSAETTAGRGAPQSGGRAADDVPARPGEPGAGAPTDASGSASTAPAEPGDEPPAGPSGSGTSRRDAAALLQEPPSPRRRSAGEEGKGTRVPAAPREGSTTTPLLDTGATAVSLSLEELLAATGLTAREVGDLERFGMLASRTLGSTAYYDENALLVARLAAAFRGHGVEARHLRMYKVAAEREAGVFEQLIMPLLRKRTPGARREAAQLVNELAALGDGLRSAMLRQLLREHLDGA